MNSLMIALAAVAALWSDATKAERPENEQAICASEEQDSPADCYAQYQQCLRYCYADRGCWERCRQEYQQCR